MPEYGITLKADGSGLSGGLSEPIRPAKELEDQLAKTAAAGKTASAESKNYVEALKQQTGAANDSGKAVDFLSSALGRHHPMLRAVATAGGIAGAVIVGVGLAAFAAAEHSDKFTQQLNRQEAALAAQGRAGSLTRQELVGLVYQLDLLPGVTRDAAAQTIASISSMRQIAGPMIGELAKLSADYAIATGTSVPDAAKRLAAAFADPAKGAKELDRELGILTATQYEAIQRYLAFGQTMEAQEVLVGALRDRIQGLNEQALTPMQRLLEGISKVWTVTVQLTAQGWSPYAFEGASNMPGDTGPFTPSMGQVYDQHGFTGDARDLRAAQAQAAAQRLQDQIKDAVGRDKFGEQRLDLQGSIAQASSILATAGSELTPEQYERIARALQDARDRLRELVDGPALKSMAVYGQQWAQAVDAGEAAADKMVYTVGENGKQIAHTREEWALFERQTTDTAMAYAKALHDFNMGVLGEEEQLATRVQSPDQVAYDSAKWQQAHDRMKRDFQATSMAIDDTLARGLVQALETGGKDGGQIFLRSLQSTFNATVLEPIFRQLFAPLSNSLTSMIMQGLSQVGVTSMTSRGLAGNLGASGAFSGGGGAAAAALGPEDMYMTGGMAGAAGAGASMFPPIAAAAGLIYARQTGLWDRLKGNPILGPMMSLADPFGFMSSDAGGPKDPTLSLNRDAASGSFWISQTDLLSQEAGSALYNPIMQQLNDRTKYDPQLLATMLGTVSGAPGTSAQQLVAQLLQKVSGASIDLPGMLAQQSGYYSTLQGFAGRLGGGVNSLQAFEDSLAVSGASGGGPLDQLAAAKGVYKSALSKVQGGDLSSINSLTSAAQSYLTLGRSVYASGGNYQGIYSDVKKALDDTLGTLQSEQKDILAEIPVTIQQGAIDTVKAITDQTKQIVDALKVLTAKINAVRDPNS